MSGAESSRVLVLAAQFGELAQEGLLLLVENEDAFYPITAGVIMFAAILQRLCETIAK